MAAPEQGVGYSMTPTQRVGFKHTSRKSDDLSNAHRPNINDGRSWSSVERVNPSKPLLQVNQPQGPPGSFSADFRNATQARSTTPQFEASSPFPVRLQSLVKDDDGAAASEQRQAAVRDKLAKEMKIKIGTENMLEALLAKNNKQTKGQRLRVEHELGSSNRKIAELRLELDQEIQRSQSPTTPPSKRMTSYFRGSPLRSPPASQTPLSEFPDPLDIESPTVVLTDTLQALEIEGMQPDYYIERANTLVDLFKRNPTLKYDLAWSVFSLRVQVMLLSESTDVVAAGYRLTRHAIADRSSLQTIRSLHTDELIVLSLVKKGKAILEREQAVKFVRAFLDVKDGVLELSRAVVRSLVAVAEHQDDRLKSICLLTLAELLAKHPALLVSAGGLTTLTDALAEGTFPAPEGLVASFLHILDHPHQCQYLSNGRHFEAMFAPFTDPEFMNSNEDKLKSSAKAIAAMLKTWPGLLTLAMDDATPLKSLVQSLTYPIPYSRDVILELLFDILRIKQPSWSSSFLAGRRLTIYGRHSAPDKEKIDRNSMSEVELDGRFDLTLHFSAIVLVFLLRAGLIPALTQVIQQEQDPALKRKATLLLTEILKLAHRSLPDNVSAKLQVLGDLMSTLSSGSSESHLTNLNMVYQIESINRTVNRTAGNQSGRMLGADELAVGPQATEKSKLSVSMDGEAFRQALQDSQVLNHSQHTKWKWDLINDLIAGPLTNPKRVDEALKSSKFLKRLTGFYRPFKYRFSGIRNTTPNQRFVRTGCALVRCLTQTQIGIQFLKESKLLRQIAECLAQVDQQSGLTSSNPVFDRHQMEETLSGGYFAILGALSETAEGIQIMERWHMMNMFYHIVERQDREDLVKALLGNMDFTLDTHLRVLLSKALTSARTAIRSFATRLLRKYAVGRVKYSAGLQDPGSSHWALRLVLTQLYDPSVEVCEMAVKILEEACDQRSHLEYVVKCRPALDHLGEIGAPLLLRFLSSSTGYRYLDGLDYITQEMDDWFLGRNDAYVAVVEASLARAYLDQGQQKNSSYAEDTVDFQDTGLLPPHFYRELARTEEGCKLLRQSGHFYEFAATIRDFGLDDEDAETLNKIKGCLWAVGNIGSMELGAPFLEESDVVKHIVHIAEGAQVMSVRGTACFALGLVSRSRHGFEMLAEYGWDTATNANGWSLGLCIPRDPTRLCLKTLATRHSSDRPSTQDLERFKSAVNDLDPTNARVLKLIVEFGNPVQYKKTASELHVIKAKHPSTFSKVPLFRKTLFILESHQYRLQARQFILDLFDKSVMRQIVLDDDSEGDETMSSSE